MQDRALVAAIIAGDPDGLADAYDRYAGPLYTYCRFMLPGPHPAADAAGAVADTFVVAASSLTGLRDPGQLRCWLYAVARNECLRQLSPAELAGEAATRAGRQPPDQTMPELTPPAGLRGQVLRACTDSTPSGRAHLASVTHRAGPFDRKGFPQPVILPGPRWWHGVQRHPRAATAVAAVAAAVVAAGITAALIGSAGNHRAHASTVAVGGGSVGTSSSAGPPGARSSPGGKPRPAPGASASSTHGPSASPDSSPDAAKSSASPRSSSSKSPSPSPSSTSPSPSPSPSSSPPPATGTLEADPAKLVLTATKGTAVSGTFLLTAEGGPVKFTIHSPTAKITVSPSTGSLPSSGSFVSVTVTVKSLVSLDSHVTVDPGGLVITVVLTIKA